MSLFTRIAIEGFRRLNAIDLKLKPLNVVIGANGSGKTSLLDVFSLLAASASGELNETLSEMGGLDQNLTSLVANHRASAMKFTVEMEVPNHRPLEYELGICAQGTGYEIAQEALFQYADQPQPFKYIESQYGNVRYYDKQPKSTEDPSPKGLVRPTWDFDTTETALSQVPKMYQQPEDFRKRLASSTHYHVLDVSRNAPVRRPQPMRTANLPGRDGEDLVSCLFTLRETNRDRFDAIEATLRAGFPDFERLNFPPVAAGVLAMTWKDRSCASPFFMHQLSEGTLRFLWLVALLLGSELPSILMIDEPEVSLHPELIALLADLLREASQRSQIVVATHADRLVRFLEPSEVLVANFLANGAAELRWADELDLRSWLDEYTLDEVWRMGRMGGRP